MYRCNRHLECVKVTAKPINDRVIVSCSVVCSTNKSSVLKTNVDTLWLTPEMLASTEFRIISNVNWNIN